MSDIGKNLADLWTGWMNDQAELHKFAGFDVTGVHKRQTSIEVRYSEITIQEDVA